MMDQNDLKKILDNHKKWLELDGNEGERANLRGADLSEADLRGADLRGADLSEADLREAYLRGADLSEADLSEADLRGAYLSEADLSEADLDFSCLPLWCGGLNFKIDDTIAHQLMYHTLNLMIYSEIGIPDSKEKLIEFANKMHRTDVKRLE